MRHQRRMCQRGRSALIRRRRAVRESSRQGENMVTGKHACLPHLAGLGTNGIGVSAGCTQITPVAALLIAEAAPGAGSVGDGPGGVDKRAGGG